MIKEIDRKKKILDNNRPFNEAAVKNLKQYFDVELTYNSNAIEGNTLTITETKVILEDGITIGKGKTLKEHLEVINHKEAIDYIEDIVNRNIDINQNVIKDFNYIILKSINNENAGRYRSVNVLTSGSNHKPPEHFLVPQEMEDLIKWYDENKNKLHPVILAAEFHHKFTFIHPFTDGNGRCGRLLMNLILMRNGYPITVIRMEDRNEYMSALEKASVENDLEDFINIIAEAVNRSLDKYLYILG
ncbi:Fic family protein [Clostridium sp. P21]|uniref:Fic family protein n=1 Tax=Clostridium muellerianum TaxID=2716538 RepID=A0A7Y0HR07_9CLOT|nr:Fic family protein [Clostridium muellerianum]NMM64353.1 Fic family protein [Clostridium muellerianum]